MTSLDPPFKVEMLLSEKTESSAVTHHHGGPNVNSTVRCMSRRLNDEPFIPEITCAQAVDSLCETNLTECVGRNWKPIRKLVFF